MVMTSQIKKIIKVLSDNKWNFTDRNAHEILSNNFMFHKIKYYNANIYIILTQYIALESFTLKDFIKNTNIMEKNRRLK